MKVFSKRVIDVELQVLEQEMLLEEETGHPIG